ncbi:MAG: pseudouridine synthase, partial [Clostridia bacterium]|nr:pseudouridine synthase [Clostridia bacterium]
MIKEGDVIKYNDEVITYEEFVYYILNKPEDYVCAREDNISKTVLELIDSSRKDLTTVGRLDKDTTGLLIITDDGKTVHDLTSPKKHVDKTYYADIDGIVKDSDIEKFKNGLDIGDDKLTLPSILKILSTDEKTNTSKIEVTISEGRYHEVKRMFESIDCKVTTLKRISIGKLNLSDLNIEIGEYKKVTKDELYNLIYGE